MRVQPAVMVWLIAKSAEAEKPVSSYVHKRLEELGLASPLIHKEF
jgi:hypothetical protein